MIKNLIIGVPGGYQVDGLHLLQANCSCGGLTNPGGAKLGDCCLTYSTVKKEDHVVAFFAKAITPNTTNNYEWGYRVKKDPVEVDVLVYDTRDSTNFTFGGHYPPPLSAWEERGWKVMAQFERPLEGIGMPLPEWCQSQEICARLDLDVASPHEDPHQTRR